MINLERGLERGPLPLWFQIKERLRRSISGGAFAPGDQLPTEHDLMEMFVVSRTTVRAALQALAHEGLVERVRGRGTFVKASPVDQPASQLAGFHEDMRLRGLIPSTRTRRVELVKPSSEVASRLGQGEEAVVLMVERSLLADGGPIAFQRSFIPRWVLGAGGPFSASDLDSKSLYDLMDDRTTSRPQTAEQTIEATGASGELTTLLEVNEGTPLLRTERISFDQYGSPVEWVELWYRSDRYRFRVELVGRSGTPV